MKPCDHVTARWTIHPRWRVVTGRPGPEPGRPSTAKGAHRDLFYGSPFGRGRPCRCRCNSHEQRCQVPGGFGAHDCPHRSRDRVVGSTRSKDPGMSPNVHQTSHELLREALRGAMGAAVGSDRGDGGIGSIPWRASAALYALLGAHPVDRRGRCRSCHGLRALLGRGRRICRVLVVARSTCTNPRTSCSATSRASCTSTPRRHPAQKRHLNRAERRVRYSAIQTPPTCSRGSAEPLGPRTQADRARPSRLRFPPAAPLGWDERPWTSARRGSPASETAGLDVLHPMARR